MPFIIENGTFHASVGINVNQQEFYCITESMKACHSGVLVKNAGLMGINPS